MPAFLRMALGISRVIFTGVTADRPEANEAMHGTSLSWPTSRRSGRAGDHRRKNLRVPMRDEITPAATPSMAANEPDDTEGAA